MAHGLNDMSKRISDDAHLNRLRDWISRHILVDYRAIQLDDAIIELQQRRTKEKETCKWPANRFDPALLRSGHDHYDLDIFGFVNADERLKFCPFCGKRIEVVK